MLGKDVFDGVEEGIDEGSFVLLGSSEAEGCDVGI